VPKLISGIAPALRVLAVMSAALLTAVGLSTAYADMVAAQPSGLAPDERELVHLIDLARSHASCPALRTDPRLTAAAQAHADDMVLRGFSSDVNPDNEDAAIRAQRQGYPGNVTEDFAVGLAEPTEVLAQWTNASNSFARDTGKRLLNCRLVSIGVGHDRGVVRPPLAAHVWVVTLGDQ
jgi:uncharacterized protein YkwD